MASERITGYCTCERFGTAVFSLFADGNSCFFEKFL